MCVALTRLGLFPSLTTASYVRFFCMTHPLLPAPRRGRIALNLAVWLLGALLVGQLGAIGWALHRKHGSSSRAAAAAAVTSAVPPSAALVAPVETPAPAAAELVTAPPAVAEGAPVSEAVSAAPVASVAAPAAVVAAPAEAFPLTDERVLFFLESALASRERGDMKAALTQLRAAVDLQPAHPRLLYELASTYEKMSLPAKASPVWDQLFALGEGAGIYFKMAQARFEQGEARPPREVETPLRLGKILERSQSASGEVEALTLRIPVQALEGAVIDPGRVSVVTQFYDEVDGEIVETDAVTDNYRWLAGEFPSWTTNTVEFLDQPYRRVASFPPAPDGGRRYHGYVVKLYYNDHLQDVLAKPAQLASRRAEPGERGLQQPVERLDTRPPPGSQVDDSLFPPLPQ